MVKDYTSVKKETFVNPGLIPCNVPVLKGATWWFPAAIPNLTDHDGWTNHKLEPHSTHTDICIYIYIPGVLFYM